MEKVNHHTRFNTLFQQTFSVVHGALSVVELTAPTRTPLGVISPSCWYSNKKHTTKSDKPCFRWRISGHSSVLDANSGGWRPVKEERQQHQLWGLIKAPTRPSARADALSGIPAVCFRFLAHCPNWTRAQLHMDRTGDLVFSQS